MFVLSMFNLKIIVSEMLFPIFVVAWIGIMTTATFTFLSTGFDILASNAAALFPSPRVPSLGNARVEGNKAAALEAIDIHAFSRMVKIYQNKPHF